MIIDFFDYPNEFPTMKWDIFYQFTIQFFKKFCIKNSNIPDYYSQKTEKIQSKKINLPPFFFSNLSSNLVFTYLFCKFG